MSQEVPDKLLSTFKEAERAVLLATSLCEDASRSAAEATRLSTAAANATEKAGALLHELRREVAVTILMKLLPQSECESTSKSVSPPTDRH
jgi:hypothetical protein